MTGDGLRFALRGGELAADAALEELESGAPAHERLRRTARASSQASGDSIARCARCRSPRGARVPRRLRRGAGAGRACSIGIAGDVHLAREAT